MKGDIKEMDGIYNITMQTPMGMEKGNISFTQGGETFSGSLNILGTKNPFNGGKLIGTDFEFSGEIKKLIKKFAYTAKGTINGDTLTATATTKFGILKINGTRE